MSEEKNNIILKKITLLNQEMERKLNVLSRLRSERMKAVLRYGLNATETQELNAKCTYYERSIVDIDKQIKNLEENLQEKDRTIVINILSGSGAGKSTMSYLLAGLLKTKGIEAEHVSEWVKDMIFENRQDIFDCQPYIFGKQLHKIQRVCGHTKVIVTDSPILLSAIYDEGKNGNAYKEVVLNSFNRFRNFNIFLDRKDIPFNPNGRNENTLEEAVRNDNKVKDFLDENNIDYIVTSCSLENCYPIIKRIEDML